MSLAGARALVVEDDRSWQEILSEILSDVGLVVDVADSLEQAEALLRAAPHRLAVVDLSLGKADHRDQAGLAVLDAVHRQDPGCVSLLLTGYATVELAVSALTEHGAFTCLRKEAFHRASFRELVGRMLKNAPRAGGHRALADEGVSVPATAGAPGDRRPEPNPAGRALAVEDDAGWRSILAELLAEAGYQVRLCASYGEARGRLRRESYDLAVVDLALASTIAPAANQDGYRLLAAIRATGIPAIVVSGTATPADIERAYAEQGVFACLEKQAFDRRTFLSTVAEARAAGPGVGAELGMLTERERQVLALLARGVSNQAIAETLVITPNTVKRHLQAIFGKLGVHTRAAAAARAISAGVPTDQA